MENFDSLMPEKESVFQFLFLNLRELKLIEILYRCILSEKININKNTFISKILKNYSVFLILESKYKFKKV